MDRELPKEVIRRRKRKKIFRISLSIIVVLTIFFGFRALISPSIDIDKIRIGIVERAPIYASVNATGTVVPKFEQIITSPINTRIEDTYFSVGDVVGKGESILKINTESLRLEYDRMLDELEMYKNNKEQLKIQLEQNRVDYQTEFDIKKLQTQFIQSQLEREQYLYDIGGGTKENLERARLNLEISRKELDQLSKQLQNLDATTIADMKELDLNINIQNKKISDLERRLRLAEVTSEYVGVVTWINDDIGSSVRQGDIIARVADLQSFKIEARISDIHTTRLSLGGDVSVKVGHQNMRGRIKSINPAVENGQINFVVALENDSDPVLRPNLRVDVYILTEYKENILRVKNGNFYRGSYDQKVYVVEDGYAYGREVDIGLTNIDYVELIGEVNPGDSLIITDMEKYRHLDKIKIDR
jgi:HlyD family secretion protein